MSMSHLSDKELDRLSREAAEQFDVEGSTSGWDALEKKLDTSMPADAPLKRRRGLWFWLTGSILLIGLLGYYFYYDNGNSVSDDAKQTVLSEQNNPVLKSSENAVNDNQVTTQSQSDAKETGKENNEERINSTKSSETDFISKTQPSGTNSKTGAGSETDLSKAQPSGTTSKTVSVSRGNNKTDSKDNTRKSSKVSESQNRNSFNVNKVTVAESSTNSQNVKANSSKIGGSISKSTPESQTITENSEPDYIKQTNLPEIDHQHNPININNSTHADSMIADLANASIPERDTSIKSNTIFPIEVGMLVGSDMSNVNFQGSDRMGLNFGISVGYRFNKRWQINTGLIHTKKYYQARGKDFHPPKGYWTDYVKLDLVAGNCSMWEIPLNVRYDLSLTRKGSWFISSGLSTYLMQQEDYDYHYWSNGNFYTRHKGYPSSEKSILGILNFSGGFEKNFTPHVSVQIEPYMRIPLKGVGFGNMQMNSFGTNFILKFKSGPAKK
jgi:hypothetical protein